MVMFFIIHAFTLSGNWATSWQNQQTDLCAQWRLRSAWASAQSDQSLRCPHEETLGYYISSHWAHSEDSVQTGRMSRLIWVFAPGAQVILLVRLKILWFHGPQRYEYFVYEIR